MLIFIILVALLLNHVNSSILTPIIPASRIRSVKPKSPALLKCNDKSVKEKNTYFFECGLAGAISCSVTHCLMLPLDVIKTKIQSSTSLGNMGTVSAVRSILKSDGYGVLFQGVFSPPLYNYTRFAR